MNKSSVTFGLVLAAVLLGALYAAAYLFPREREKPAPQIAMADITPKFMGEVAFGRWRLICAMVGDAEGVGSSDEAPESPAPATGTPEPAPTVIPEPMATAPEGAPAAPAAPPSTATPAPAAPAATAAPAAPRRVCRLNYVIASGGEKPRIMAGVNILAQKNGDARQAVLVLRLPPQVKGGDGVIVWVDDKDKSKLPLGTCNEKECLAQSAVPDKLLQEMLGGKTLSLAIPAPENKRLKLDANLPGFKLGWEALGRAL